MDDHFFNSEFEKFLQQQVKQHRMYPSDVVWKGIYKQIHGDKKWPGLYFIAILLVAALTVCTLFMDSAPIVYPQAAVVAKEKPAINQFDPVQVTQETITVINTNRPEGTNAVSISAPIAALAGGEDVVPDNRIYTGRMNTGYPATDISGGSTESLAGNNVITLPAEQKEQAVSNPASLMEEKADLKQDIAENKNTESTKPQEPVITSIKITEPVKPGKWQYQFYITPSTSYREVVDKKPTGEQFNAPMAYGANASQVIRYKPGMGIELGVGILYSLTDRLKIKSSLQYNIRQYNIEAFAGDYETARIALVRGNSIDNIPTVAKYRSTNGYEEALLLNKYHQISLPVGVEYAVLNAKGFAINLAGSLQPTYTFSQSSYLLTSDYKSYADGTSMIRKWNLNSSLEATFSYKVGDFQWKLGPQIRYQHLPTYTDPYPIKEYLIDYGFKIGFTKTIR